MIRSVLLVVCAAMLWLAGCATTPPTDNTTTSTGQAEQKLTRKLPPSAGQSNDDDNPVVAMTFGRGIAQAPDPLTFSFNISVYEDDSVEGTFTYSTSGNGVDIDAEVLCATLDHKSGRAWIGGTITRNDSTDPRYSSAPGDEVWMRVLDRNLQKMPPMISEPLFRTANVRGARNYCQRRPWSDEGLFVVQPGALAIFP